MERVNKKVVLVAIDESEDSLYALSWAIDHLFQVPVLLQYPHEVAAGTKLVVVHAYPHVHSYIHSAGPGSNCLFLSVIVYLLHSVSGFHVCIQLNLCLI
jgi:hypothetical protein